jgi:hypothetical protein
MSRRIQASALQWTAATLLAATSRIASMIGLISVIAVRD